MSAYIAYTARERDELQCAFQRLRLSKYPYQESVDVRHRPGRGWGLFALEYLPAGSPIIIDRHIFWVAVDVNIPGFAAHFPDFQTLHCPPLSANQRADHRRFKANCFEMGETPNGGNPIPRYGIFMNASRINHSCTPNAHFSWNSKLAGTDARPENGRLTIYTIKDIAKNDEILINYGANDYHQSRADRQTDFHGVYGFFCTCPACNLASPFYASNEINRKRMRTIAGRLNANRNRVTQAGREQHFSDINAMLRLLRQNDTVYPQQADILRELAEWHETDMANTQGAAARAATEADGYKAATQALDLDIICTGYESQPVRDTLAVALRLKP